MFSCSPYPLEPLIIRDIDMIAKLFTNTSCHEPNLFKFLTHRWVYFEVHQGFGVHRPLKGTGDFIVGSAEVEMGFTRDRAR